MARGYISRILEDERKVKEIATGIFQEADSDNSGSIDRKELKGLLSKLTPGETIPDDVIDECFKSIDINGDGVLSLEEFTIVVRKILEAMNKQ